MVREGLPATLAGREAPPARHSRLRWTPVALLSGAAVLLLVQIIGSVVPDPTAALSAAPAAAPSAAPARTTAPARSTTAAPSPTATPSSTPADPLAMTADQQQKTREELVDLGGRLPTGITLTAPGAWARWAGASPSYARDIDGCPHLAARLAQSLGGGRWTYVFGTLPQGGCTWVPVPWIPKQPAEQRFSLTVEFEQGPVDALLQRPTYCVGGDVAPTLGVPDVATGAVLSGCDDADGPTVQLALPDAGGTGVWFLGGSSGAAQTRFAPADGLLALVDAARAVYG